MEEKYIKFYQSFHKGFQNKKSNSLFCSSQLQWSNFKKWFNKSMQSYIILFFAVALEVLGTMLLPASQNFTKPIPTSILLVSYGASFYFLALVSHKLPLAIIYASWAGLGVFSVAILSYFFYKQTLNWQTIIGLFLIIIGVTIVNLYKTKIWRIWMQKGLESSHCSNLVSDGEVSQRQFSF